MHAADLKQNIKNNYCEIYESSNYSEEELDDPQDGIFSNVLDISYTKKLYFLLMR